MVSFSYTVSFLGGMFMSRAMWSFEEEELLKKVYSLKTANQLREIFPQYTREQVYRKAKKLGLKKDELVSKQSRVENSIIQRQDLWEEEEIKILLEYYPKYGEKKVRKIIKEELGKNRNESAIIRQANRRNLCREQKNVLTWVVEEVSPNIENGFSVKIKYKGY